MAKAERSCVSITRLVPDGWTAGGSIGGGRARRAGLLDFERGNTKIVRKMDQA